MFPASSQLISKWLHTLQSHVSTNQRDDPHYYANNPQKLMTTSEPTRISVGTGHQILSSVLPTCLSTEHELILVTCFWAKSSSQEAISSLLQRLSSKAQSQNRKIQVRICFSSRSITQKLFQTSSLNGKIYPPSSWTSLGLPHPTELTGLEMVVKSVFVRPFSVMHPKFILVDRQKAFMPSCNVSWESWFEGCVEMQGGVCATLFEFWDRFWSRGGAELPDLLEVEDSKSTTESISAPAVPSLDVISFHSFNAREPVPTILLPSPHHVNPNFNLFSKSTPPPSPLNTFLLEAITSANRSIYLQTPNLTCRAVIAALISALQRGVSITIITSRRLMILEQLATAGTITEFEIWKLRRRYAQILAHYSNPDPESQRRQPGTLKIGYYHARSYEDGEQEPVKTHLKLTIVDEEVVVLGSGNMDRASWYTSQELGVAFFGSEIAKSVSDCVHGGLIDRVSYCC